MQMLELQLENKVSVTSQKMKELTSVTEYMSIRTKHDRESFFFKWVKNISAQLLHSSYSDHRKQNPTSCKVLNYKHISNSPQQQEMLL